MKNNKILAVSVFIFMLLFSLQVFAADGKVTLSVAKVEAEANVSVNVPITMSDNTGICGAIIKVSYNKKLILTGVEKGSALSSLTMTPPGNKSENPFKLMWDGLEADDTNGEIAVLTFSAPAEAGTYDISVSYEPDEVIDGDFAPVDLELIDGSVTVVDGLLHTHEGGEATCSKKAVCSICGEEYGELNPENHQNVTVINQKEPTFEEEGYTGDTYCNDCHTVLTQGEVIPVLQEGVILRLGEINCRSGKEIIVPVMIENNSGIAGFSFDILYDDKLLTLKSAANGSLLTTGTTETSGDTINWYTADNISGDGEILSLVFEVSKDAPTGESVINIAPHDGKQNLVDENGNYVEANYLAGIVKIRKGVLGDVNEDEDITIADVVLLNRSILGKYTLAETVIPFADVNDDKEISIGDVVILNRHVLGKETIEEARDYLAIMADYLGIAGAASIYVEDTAIRPGATIGVPVRIEDNKGLAGLALTFTIPDGFTLNSISRGGLLTSGTFSTEGSSFTWYSTDYVGDDGELVTLNITADEDAESGIIQVAATDGEKNNLTDEHGGTLFASFGAGAISVAEASECDVYGHTPGDVVIENESKATCLAPGSYEEVIYCSVCKEEISRETKSTGYADHTWADEPVTDTAPTCTENGLASIHCRVCGAVKPGSGYVVNMTGHTFIRVDASEPSCEKEGNIAYWHCSVCGEDFLNDDGSEPLTQEQIVITALEHEWDVGEITKEATPDNPGEKTYTCSLCGKTRTEEVEYVPPTVIHEHAFAGNTALQTFTIGASITEIEDEAFAGCENLKEIYFEGDMPALGKDVFKDIDPEAVIYYPADNQTWNEQALVEAGIQIRTASWDVENQEPIVKDLSECTVVLSYQETDYDGMPKEPEVTVKDGQMILKADQDYTVLYGENVNAGTGTVEVTGWENYTGTSQATFMIAKAKGKIELLETDKKLTTEDADFDMQITSLLTDGTVRYESSNPSVATVDESTGHVQLLAVGNTELTATAEGNNYTTEKAVMRLKVSLPTHAKKSNEITASDITVKGNGKARSVALKATALGDGKLSYKSDRSNVKVNGNGVLSVPATFAGRVRVTVSSEETDDYQPASKTVDVIVLPTAPVLSKVKASGSKKAKVTWKRNVTAQGYELQYATNKAFTKKLKTVTIGSQKTVKKKVKKLKGGKKYFFRIRSYVTVNGKKYYSGWSNVKKAKIKK